VDGSQRTTDVSQQLGSFNICTAAMLRDLRCSDPTGEKRWATLCYSCFSSLAWQLQSHGSRWATTGSIEAVKGSVAATALVQGVSAANLPANLGLPVAGWSGDSGARYRGLTSRGCSHPRGRFRCGERQASSHSGSKATFFAQVDLTSKGLRQNKRFIWGWFFSRFHHPRILFFRFVYFVSGPNAVSP
jgi:hypothetical protein